MLLFLDWVDIEAVGFRMVRVLETSYFERQIEVQAGTEVHCTNQ